MSEKSLPTANRALTEKDIAAARFKKESAKLYDLDTSEETVHHVLINLSQNLCRILTPPNLYSVLTAEDSRIQNYSVFLNRLAQRIPSADARETLLEAFSAQNLLKEYEDGELFFEQAYPYCAPGQAPAWLESKCRLVMNPENGNVYGFLYTYNRTEAHHHKKVFEAAIDLEYDYISILNVASGVYTLYKKNRIEKENEFFNTFNYTEELVRYCRTAVPPEDIDAVMHALSIDTITEALNATGSYTYYVNMYGKENRIQRKLLQMRWLDKDRQYILFKRTDVTDAYYHEKREQQRLTDALSHAEERYRALSALLTEADAGLREAVNASLRQIELLGRAADTQDGLHRLKNHQLFIRQTLEEITQTLTHFSGDSDVRAEACTLQRIVANLEKAVLEACSKKNLHLSIEKPRFTGQISTDKTRLELILLNLLKNAVQFTPEGGIVELRMFENTLKPDVLSCDFMVRDTGIGMSESFQHKMFEPFAIEDESAASGSGLGLPIVKKNVVLLGGTISVKSARGAGTVIVIHLDLPIVQASAGSEQKLPVPVLPRGARVLLAEADADEAKAIALLLSEKGIQTDLATNGIEFLNRFVARPPWTYDALILDCALPIMDGFSAARALRTLVRPDARMVPVLALISSTDQKTQSRLKYAGVRTVLLKPFTGEELYNALSAQLQLSFLNKTRA